LECVEPAAQRLDVGNGNAALVGKILVPDFLLVPRQEKVCEQQSWRAAGPAGYGADCELWLLDRACKFKLRKALTNAD